MVFQNFPKPTFFRYFTPEVHNERYRTSKTIRVSAEISLYEFPFVMGLTKMHTCFKSILAFIRLLGFWTKYLVSLKKYFLLLKRIFCYAINDIHLNFNCPTADMIIQS